MGDTCVIATTLISSEHWKQKMRVVSSGTFSTSQMYCEVFVFCFLSPSSSLNNAGAGIALIPSSLLPLSLFELLCFFIVAQGSLIGQHDSIE